MARHFLGTGATVVLMMVFTLMSGVATSRLLGPADRGVLVTFMLWPTIAALIADLGSSISIVRRSANGKESLEPLVNAALIISLSSIILLPLGLVVQRLTATSASTSEQMLGLGLFLVYTPSLLGARLFSSISQGRQNFRHYNVTRLMGPMVWAIGATVMLALDVPSLHALIGVLALSGFLSMAVGIMPYRRMAHLTPSLEVCRVAIGLVRENVKAHIGNMAPIDSMKLDTAAVSLLASPTSVGLYSVASATGYLIRLVGHVLGIIGLPLVAAEANLNSGKVIAKRVTLLAGLGSVIGVTLFIPSIPLIIQTLYGDDFRSAALPAQVLSVGMVCAGVRQCLSDCLRGIGWGAVASQAEIASWLVAIAGFSFLLTSFGILGAAIATTLTFIAALLFTVAIVSSKADAELKTIIAPSTADLRWIFHNLIRFRPNVEERT